MLIKRTEDCNEFTANDGCRIRELLHPANDRDTELPFSVALARVAPGKHSYDHYLEQVEVYYIISGRGVMHIDEEAAEVGPGDTVYIPALARQWIENPGPEELVFTAIVSPPWTEEGDIRL